MVSNTTDHHSPGLRLILASGSPRRAQLLQSIGLPFTVAAVSWVEPEPEAGELRTPELYVERLARGKAQAYIEPGPRRDACIRTGESTSVRTLVLTADTTVWIEGCILNKPRDATDAGRMLRLLRGRQHLVLTGLCLREHDLLHVEHEVTKVWFHTMSDAWIDRYVASGEPLDKAGAYGAQALGAAMIERIEGDFSNVVGLPLGRLGKMLERLGAPLEHWW